MTKPTKVDIGFPINEVKVVNDLYCTQLTHRVARHEPDDSPRNLKYEVYDNCIGTKVVQINGKTTFKFHDGCLGRVSYELGEMAKTSDVVVIEPEHAESAARALNYVLQPFNIKSLTSKQKYDLVLFGARYGLPPNHISKLIDRSIYADLVGYAWKNNNTYLMTMLPKLRFPDVEIIEDFLNIDGQTWFKFVRPSSLPPKADVESGDIINSEDKTRLKKVCMALQPTVRITDEELTADFSKVAERNLDKFVRKYMEHEHRLKKYGRFRVFIILVAVGVWFALLYGAIYVDGPWKFKNKGGN